MQERGRYGLSFMSKSLRNISFLQWKGASFDLQSSEIRLMLPVPDTVLGLQSIQSIPPTKEETSWESSLDANTFRLRLMDQTGGLLACFCSAIVLSGTLAS